MITWHLSKYNDKLFILKQYQLDVTLLEPQNTNDKNNSTNIKYETLQIVKYRRLKRKTRTLLAMEVGIDSTRLNVGYIDIRSDKGCGINVIQHISKIEIEDYDGDINAYLKDLYDDKYENIAEAIQGLYHLSWGVFIKLGLLDGDKRDYITPQYAQKQSNASTISLPTIPGAQPYIVDSSVSNAGGSRATSEIISEEHEEKASILNDRITIDEQKEMEFSHVLNVVSNTANIL